MSPGAVSSAPPEQPNPQKTSNPPTVTLQPLQSSQHRHFCDKKILQNNLAVDSAFSALTHQTPEMVSNNITADRKTKPIR
jgi:hypothetical protein